ncbi:hypothetical protein [Ruegeria sp. HKCCA5426]|uniref:hypothetical protein n=1 Tax=Ruegeria sp. HKCCA5426 TaxID=2682985 RepID=UPI001487EC7B|nr:hypothetical protein [Ruegeria sp. HKCCA5426]
MFETEIFVRPHINNLPRRHSDWIHDEGDDNAIPLFCGAGFADGRGWFTAEALSA